MAKINNLYLACCFFWELNLVTKDIASQLVKKWKALALPQNASTPPPPPLAQTSKRRSETPTAIATGILDGGSLAAFNVLLS